MTGPDLARAASIAVLRANGIGDYLTAEPALAALRAAAPHARITLLGGAWHAQALQDRPGPVDEVITLPDIEGLTADATDAADWADFRDRMRARRFDVAIQMHGGGRTSNPVVGALGAGLTVGLQARDAPPLDRVLSYQYWQPEVHRYLELVALVGATPLRTQPRFTVTGADLDAADEVLRAAVPAMDRPLVVIHPGATDPHRRWPPERFAQVARGLCEAAAVVVLGSSSEAGLVAEVVRGVPGAVAAVALPFTAMVGLLHRAALVIGNDSGPRHLAEAVGTPTVSVYWFGNVINAGPQQRRQHRVHISWTTNCPVCGTFCVGEPFPARCYDDVSFVADVGVRAVADSAGELLEQSVPMAVRAQGGRRYG